MMVHIAGDLTWVLALDPLTGDQTPFLRRGNSGWLIPGRLPNDVGFAALGPDGFLATGDDGIAVSLMISEDAGETWTARHPPGTSATYGLHRGPDGTLYALFDHSDRFLSVSTDRGKTWSHEEMDQGIDFRRGAEPAFVTGKGGTLAVLFERGAALRSGATRPFLYPPEVAARRLGAAAFFDDGTSTFPAGTWLPTDSPVRHFLVRDNVVLALFWDDVYRSNDGGETWASVGSDYPWKKDPLVEINHGAVGSQSAWVATTVGLFEVPLNP